MNNKQKKLIKEIEVFENTNHYLTNEEKELRLDKMYNKLNDLNRENYLSLLTEQELEDERKLFNF